MAPKTPTITSAEFAADHGVSLRRVQQWIAEGMPYRDVNGERRIARVDANKWLRAYEREQAEARAKKPSGLVESEERKAAADAQLAELKLAREQGQVVEIEETRRTVAAMLTQLRAQLLSLPARWAPKVVGIKTVAEASLTLEAAIHEALTALSAE